MARSGQEVNAELRRLHCEMEDDHQLGALARALVHKEIIVDAIHGAYIGNSQTTVVVTGEEILRVIHERSWWSEGKTTVRSLYWQDIAEINTDGACLAVIGHGNAGRLDVEFDRSVAESERFKEFVQGLRDRLAAERSPQSHRARQPKDSLIGKFDRLAVLSEQGHIDKEDLAAAKGKLLHPTSNPRIILR